MASKKRKRASRAMGIGRGNSAGSKAGQFQSGEPSRNPIGRPLKVKGAVNPDLRTLFRQMLSAKVPVRENGASGSMPQLQAMIKVMLNGFAHASPREQLAIMKFIMTDIVSEHPNGEAWNRDIPAQSIAEFVAGLALEYEQDLEKQRLFDASWPQPPHPPFN